MDNFQGTNWIVLQPLDSGVYYNFAVSVCSTSTANDGAIPYGTTVSGVAVSAYSATAAVDGMVDSVALEDNVITTALSCPAGAATGTYKLTFALSLTDGSTRELDFKRLKIVDN